MKWTTVGHDPALAAAERARMAEAAFLEVPAHVAVARGSPQTAFIAAEEEWATADERFADAVPRTAAGAMAKLKAVEDMLRTMRVDEDSLEMRHVQSLLCYLESLDPGA